MNFKAINNNLKHDIWGNYMMARQLGRRSGYGYLAKKTIALAKAVFSNRTIEMNDHTFYDTWGS